MYWDNLLLLRVLKNSGQSWVWISHFISGILRKSIIDNKSIEIRDFGTFWVKRISERKTGRNPKTGESIYVPQKNKLRFKASKFLRNFVNKD